jgi:hypothetical protein
VSRSSASSVLLLLDPEKTRGLMILYLILFFSEHRSEEKVKTFEEGEVYGVDVLVATSADGKASSGEARTTIYKKSDITYQLKMKNSRTVFAEIQKKVGLLLSTSFSLLAYQKTRC